MRVEKINNMATTNAPAFNGFVCEALRTRAMEFALPEKMEKYRRSAYVRNPNTGNIELPYFAKKMQRKSENIDKKIDVLKECMNKNFDEFTYLTVRDVKEDAGKSTLTLFNTRTGIVRDVLAHFNTDYGDISNVITRFTKKAHNFKYLV